MCKNVEEEAEIVKRLIAYCITLTRIEKEMIGSLQPTKEAQTVERMRICMLCTQSLIIARNHLSVEENYNLISLERTLMKGYVMKCVIIAKLD